MLSDYQNLNRLTGNRDRLHSAHWLASSLKLAARCPVSGCWPSCVIRAEPITFLGDCRVGVGQECGDGGATACQCLHYEQCHCHQTFLGLTRH